MLLGDRDAWEYAKLPKAIQPKIKDALHNIYLAETRENATILLTTALKNIL